LFDCFFITSKAPFAAIAFSGEQLTGHDDLSESCWCYMIC